VSITRRIDALTQLDGVRARDAPPVPRSAKIEITARCDARCFFCASPAKLRKRADMDWLLYRRLAREFRELGVEELGVFNLGESFLCDWLPEAIGFAKQDCGYPYVFLTTNGRLATPDRVEACMRAGLDSLKFSFNFSGAREFHEVTGVKASWYQEVVSNIKAARKVRERVARSTGHRCGLYASSIRYDGEQQARMAEAVKGITSFVDEHYWLPLCGQAGLTNGARGTRAAAGNPGRVDALRDPLPCWTLFNVAHVTYEGGLSACCFDHDGRFKVGDLRRDLFMDAWHSPGFRKLRSAHLKRDVRGTDCERCISAPHQ
jgi:MoaA/NifB/PqqE/SkfB family radical SAM enzyme